MRRHNRSRTLTLASGLLVWALAHAGGAATPRLDISSATLPPTRLLDEPRPEAPSGLTPEIPSCTACRLAARTTGQLPGGALDLDAQVLEHGILLHVTSKDPEAREVLWKATIARGELLAQLRAGEPVELCEACRGSLEGFRDLRISARRVPEGVVLVYSSTSDLVVRTLHDLANTVGGSSQF